LKPLHLNLASRPYRDYRPLYAVVVGLSLLIAFLALENIETYYEYTKETKTTRARIEKLESDRAQEERRAEIVASQVARIDVSGLRSQTSFVNAKLAERTFSWSELLDRLENVTADDVRILSITPTFENSGNVRLVLRCEGKSADGMIEMLDRFNANPQFSDPFPSNETANETGYQFGITVLYRPTIARVVR
jgi:DNA primase catalytic subunit